MGFNSVFKGLNLPSNILTFEAPPHKDRHYTAVPKIIAFADGYCKEQKRLYADVRPGEDVVVR